MGTMKQIEILTSDLYYRFESTANSGDVKLRCHSFHVIRYTPCGAWLLTHEGPKFVLDNARKSFAYSTIEKAKISFAARKRSQIKIVTHQLRHAETALRLVTNGAPIPCYPPVEPCRF